MINLVEPDEEVLFVDRAEGVVLFGNGTTNEVDTWFDRQGDECEAHEAIVCVTQGPSGQWWIVDLTALDERTIH